LEKCSGADIEDKQGEAAACFNAIAVPLRFNIAPDAMHPPTPCEGQANVQRESGGSEEIWLTQKFEYAGLIVLPASFREDALLAKLFCGL
jgi:hypothetical protein